MDEETKEEEKKRRCRERERKYRQNSKDLLRDKRRRYRLKHSKKLWERKKAKLVGPKLDAMRAYRKKWAESHKDEKLVNARRSFLRRKYGLSLADFDRILGIQGGGCKICGEKPGKGRPNLHVDHCHATNRVRGLLCFACNAGLGHFRDNAEILAKASAYIRENY